MLHRAGVAMWFCSLVLTFLLLPAPALAGVKERHLNSHTSRRHITINLVCWPNEDNAMPRRVSLIPFHFGVWHGYPRSIGNISFAVGDDRNVVVALHLERIGLVRISLP